VIGDAQEQVGVTIAVAGSFHMNAQSVLNLNLYHESPPYRHSSVPSKLPVIGLEMTQVKRQTSDVRLFPPPEDPRLWAAPGGLRLNGFNRQGPVFGL